ncbi:MAG: sugar phosphate isomerase/epimerase [Defluviitaleaceae bacterium]|nr:sugar phosphate isomerase/epimerase [Defluviitaleaceae bacterium]
MKIGVRAHDFGRQSAKSLAGNIKNAGFECTQLAPAKAIEGINSFADITERHLEIIQEVFDKADLEITVLGCYIEPSLIDNEERLKHVEIFRNNIVYAKQLNIPIVGTETTHMDINAPTDYREKVYQLLKDSVLRMVEMAERENVWIGIEPVAEHTLNTPELARRLLDEVGSKQLKIIFDPLNLVLPSTINQQDEIYAKTIALLGEEVVAMHIKDTVIENNEKTWRNIGAGVINYKPIINWLKQSKPNMRLLREGVAMDSYKKDLEVMKQLIK